MQMLMNKGGIAVSVSLPWGDVSDADAFKGALLGAEGKGHNEARDLLVLLGRPAFRGRVKRVPISSWRLKEDRVDSSKKRRIDN